MKEGRILSHLRSLAMQTDGIDGGRIRMAAAIVHKKRLVSVGINRMKSHPIMLNSSYREGQYYLHAETDAIVNSKMTDFSECDMYILRIKKPYPGAKKEVLGLAKPCPGCADILSTHNFKNVYYTTDFGTLDVL